MGAGDLLIAPVLTASFSCPVKVFAWEFGSHNVPSQWIKFNSWGGFVSPLNMNRLVILYFLISLLDPLLRPGCQRRSRPDVWKDKTAVCEQVDSSVNLCLPQISGDPDMPSHAPMG